MALSPEKPGKFALTTLAQTGVTMGQNRYAREEGPYNGEIAFRPGEMANARQLSGVFHINDGTRELELAVTNMQGAASHMIEYKSATYTEGGKAITIDLSANNGMNQQVGDRLLKTITTFGQALKNPQAETPFVDLVLADTMQVAHDGSGLDIISKVAHAVELAGKPGGDDGGAAAPARAKLAVPRM